MQSVRNEFFLICATQSVFIYVQLYKPLEPFKAFPFTSNYKGTRNMFVVVLRVLMTSGHSLMVPLSGLQTAGHPISIQFLWFHLRVDPIGHIRSWAPNESKSPPTCPHSSFYQLREIQSFIPNSEFHLSIE